MTTTSFTEKVIEIIQNIPAGKVTTYGCIAFLAGSPRAARQVSWILHSLSKKYDLPWHRVVNTKGKISLKPGMGYKQQLDLLLIEDIKFNKNGKIDLKKYGWQISKRI